MKMLCLDAWTQTDDRLEACIDTLDNYVLFVAIRYC